MRFGVDKNRYVVLDEEGNSKPLPFMGHADSVIEALRRHGGVATLQERKRANKYSYGTHIEITLTAPDDAGYYERYKWELNSYLIDRAVETGLLIKQKDGTVALNTELADAYDQWQAWKEQRQRESSARHEMAVEWGRYKHYD